eukprot:756015-Hanusia_phi.AAC.2
MNTLRVLNRPDWSAKLAYYTGSRRREGSHGLTLVSGYSYEDVKIIADKLEERAAGRPLRSAMQLKYGLEEEEVEEGSC